MKKIKEFKEIEAKYDSIKPLSVLSNNTEPVQDQFAFRLVIELTINSPPDRPINMSKLQQSQSKTNRFTILERHDLCQKYLTDKQLEHQLQKLSPNLPSAFDLRKGVTK